MPRPVKHTAYNKLVLNAQKSKHKVKQNKIAAYTKFQSKLGKKNKKLDAADAKLRKALKDIEAEKDANEKTLMRVLRMLEGVHKDIKMFKEIPVGQTIPAMPKATIGLSSIAVVLTAMIAYVAAVKMYMAMADALSQEKA